MSGFRKSHNCQSVLMRLTHECKKYLDVNHVYETFDCLPHKLLISKLKAYGVDMKSCMLVANYFQYRKQRVKVSGHKSDGLSITKGAAQGSMFGPFAYDIHSNDLLYLMSNICDIYNYADDNTLGYGGNIVNVTVTNWGKTGLGLGLGRPRRPVRPTTAY